MAGKKYIGKDKIVSKMTQEGLVEENLADVIQEKVDADEMPRIRGSDRKRLSASRVRDDRENLQKSDIKKKQMKQRVAKEQTKAGRLTFDAEGSKMIKGAGMGIGRKSVVNTVQMADSLSEQKSEDDESNVAGDEVFAGQIAGETIINGLRRAQLRSKRSDVKAHRRGFRSDEKPEQKLKFGTTEASENIPVPELVRKQEEKKSMFNRFFQRKRYKDAYKAAKAGKGAGTIGGVASFGGMENITVRAKMALKEITKRNTSLFIGLGVFGMLFLIIATSLGSCGASIQGGGSVIGMTTYPSSDEDIYAAENAYSALEDALNRQINQMEATHPGYDEYNYNVSEITHNPYHLISYLTAKYGDWKYAEIESEIRSLFSEQYELSTEEKTETVTETRNVRVGESLGNVVTSGYCGCSVCCGQWAGGPTASGIYPTANHTIAVDARNPFVPMGTKIVMNGVEYTVEDTGAFARYGVQFDVYYDNHSAALAHGHRTWEAFVADSNGNQEVTVTNTVTKKILNVTLKNSGFDAVARAKLSEKQLIIYNALNTTYGNRDYLWDRTTISNGGGSDGISYEIPPEALQDEEFARMIREAEKYLGTPYVWGGYAPGGFDCSGFVSYVVNHCGNGWDYGRLTANGLKSRCAFVSPDAAKPGDLIFFQGTYNTSGASHVGIYVGNNMMIHCGDPIQYANIGTPYWQQHFLCFGRLP